MSTSLSGSIPFPFAHRSLINQPGVYLIHNEITCKGYVGSTLELRKRVCEHFRVLRQGKHHNPHLQRAWNVSGSGAFTFRLLEQVASGSLTDLRLREEFWIAHFQSVDPRYGYNLSAGTYAGRHSEATKRKIARGNTGKTHSEETRTRISIAKKGQPGPWLGKRRSLETRLRISQSLVGKHPSDATREKMAAARQGHQITQSGRKRIALAQATVPYQVINPEGTSWTIYNLSAFCREHGLDQRAMCALASGRGRTHRGWQCRRVITLE